MSIIKKFKKLSQQIKEMKEYDPWLRDLPTGRIMLSYLYCHYRYGVSITKYEQYEFCRLNHIGRKSFVCERYGAEIWNVSNPREARSITGDKAAFNKRFAPFLHRRFLDAASASYEDFSAFVDGVDRFISKPFMGASGKGIEVVQNNGRLPKEQLYREYHDSKCLLEEVVVQHGEMAKLHPESLNTMRIATLRDRDSIVIMGAALRIGTGSEVVDNFHRNGIVACIDIESGVVRSTGVNYRHQRFVRHPDTGVQIVGFRIPHWENVAATVVKAAELLPEMDYVGWDVAIDSKENVLLIEGNSIPDYDVLQVASQEGLYYKYKPIIDEKRRLIKP